MRIPIFSKLIIPKPIRRSPHPKTSLPTWRSWRAFYKPLIAFLLALLITVSYGLLVSAAMITGRVERYSPAIRQAWISLGEANGVGKYDRGQIELVSQDNPNARFIAANIVVLRVNQNSSLVEVREKDGLQVEIGRGAHVLLDIGSGQARREEDMILAQEAEVQQAEIAQQRQRLEQVQRQRQLEQAQAQRAQRELELAQAREREAVQQQELEVARNERLRTQQAQQQQREQQQTIEEQIAAEQLRQQELEVAIAQEQQRQQDLQTAIADAEQAQREFELAQAEETRAQQELEAQQVALQQPQPTLPRPDEARELWKQPAEASIVAGGPNADLPEDYLQAYIQARSQPTPEHYYGFAQVLIDYELPDKALMWLDEAEQAFPETKPINDVYEAIALADIGRPEQGLTLLDSSGFTQSQMKDEIRSYILTAMGEWEQVIEVASTTPSAVTQNNRMIAQYCQEPPEIDRSTDLPPMPCSIKGKDVTAEPTDEGLEEVQAISQSMVNRYPRDPYVLSTLGFLSLQIEDYEGAYRFYKEMSRLLDRTNNPPPQLIEVKASAINYLNNYNQNYDFLNDQSQDLALLRAEYGQAMGLSAARGILGAVAGVAAGASPPNIAFGAIRAIDGIFRSRSRRRQIRREQNGLLDQMRTIFRQDLGYVAARPSLEPREMLPSNQQQPALVSLLHLK